MVRHCLSVILTFLGYLCTASAAELSVQLDRTEVEIGKYINAKIIYSGEQSVGTAKLQQWQPHFVIDRRDTETESLIDGQIQTTEKLRLYPRKTGELLLQSIALGGAIAAPIRVQVNPSIRNGIDGTPQWQSLPNQVWQGEPFEIAIKTALLHPSNRIKVEEPQFPGFKVAELPRITRTNNKGKTVIYRWQLIAQTFGVTQLTAPSIEQRGRGRWRYYLAPQTIKINPLPSYIPPTVPVGSVQAEARILDRHGKQFWVIDVSNTGNLANEIYGLRTQLAKLANHSVTDVIIENLASTNDALNQQRYLIPIANWSLGRLTSSPIKLRYFDTTAGQLKTLYIDLPSTWNIPAYGHVVLGILCATILFYSLFLFNRQFRKYRNKRQITQDILAIKTANELRQYLLSIEQLSSREACTADKHNAEQRLANKLNQLCFADAQTASLVTIKALAISIIQAR